MVKHLNPEGVTARSKGSMTSHRSEYITPGPNFLWSIDAHCKLDWFGFQIYAAIDAYSRYITWIYVGIIAHTAVSVLKQYLDTVEELGIQPQILRSDRGSETPMVADAHYQIALKLRTSITLKDCFFFGTSVANQRIESWWGQITKRALYRWRVRLYTFSTNNNYANRQTAIFRKA